MNKDSKIYIVGHTGLVGSSLVRKYKKEGFTNIIGHTSRELDFKISSQKANNRIKYNNFTDNIYYGSFKIQNNL